MRLDIRRMLIKRGWEEDPELYCVLRKGGAVWASMPGGDSQLDGPARGRKGRGEFVAQFGAETPAAVVVAAAEAAAA